MLQKLASIDLSNKSFPYMTAQRFNILQIPVLGIRISYVGELGWEIYTSTEYGSKLWESLWEVGQNYGIVAAGSGAFESLRVEKGYRLWGTDIHTEYNPLEAGLNFSVKMNKGDFIGKSSLEKIIAKGVTQSLSCLVFDNPNHLVMGKEPILPAGESVGYVTSANFGYTTGKSNTGYAESTDGINWEKPELGIIDFEGSKTNNLVWNGPGWNMSPFKDPNPDVPELSLIHIS